MKRVLVTGATGFVGSALLPQLLRRGLKVRAISRQSQAPDDRIEWMKADIGSRDGLTRALEGVDVAFYLVHDMKSGDGKYADREAHQAELFREIAAIAGVQRIIYLGGVAPSGEASEHLASRAKVGEILRSGQVPTLELRASMIIGAGSTSWQLVRDLAMRLPVMVLPQWTKSKTRPVAIEDVITALMGALEVPLEKSVWFDIPGPEVLTGSDLLMRVARMQGRHVPALEVPFLTVGLSSWWLRLITRAEFSVARELVLGFTSDLLPRDEKYWALIEAPHRLRFETAARRAMAAEGYDWSPKGLAGGIEEAAVAIIGRTLARRRA